MKNKDQSFEEKLVTILRKSFSDGMEYLRDIMSEESKDTSRDDLVMQLKSLFLEEVMNAKPENNMQTGSAFRDGMYSGFNEALDQFEKNIRERLEEK